MVFVPKIYPNGKNINKNMNICEKMCVIDISVTRILSFLNSYIYLQLFTFGLILFFLFTNLQYTTFSSLVLQ